MGRPLRIHNGETMVPLQPVSTRCLSCGHTARVAYHTQRRITHLARSFLFIPDRPAVFSGILSPLSPSLPTRREKSMGTATRRIWPGCDSHIALARTCYTQREAPLRTLLAHERTPRLAAPSYCRGDPCGRPEAHRSLWLAVALKPDGRPEGWSSRVEVISGGSRGNQKIRRKCTTSAPYLASRYESYGPNHHQRTTTRTTGARNTNTGTASTPSSPHPRPGHRHLLRACAALRLRRFRGPTCTCAA